MELYYMEKYVKFLPQGLFLALTLKVLLIKDPSLTSIFAVGIVSAFVYLEAKNKKDNEISALQAQLTDLNSKIDANYGELKELRTHVGTNNLNKTLKQPSPIKF